MDKVHKPSDCKYAKVSPLAAFRQKFCARFPYLQYLLFAVPTLTSGKSAICESHVYTKDKGNFLLFLRLLTFWPELTV
jgi:hypothetical protein